MRWFGCSTIGSKKRATLKAVLGLCAVVSLHGADLAMVVFPEDGFLVVDATVLGYTGPSIVETVNEGLRAEVRFDIQIYRDEAGLAGLLGDTLLAAYSPTHLAHWDPFERVYTIEYPNGTRTTAEEPGGYLEAFFTLTGYRISASVFDGGGSYYLLGRAAVVPIRLVPTLSILSVFTDREIDYTGWVRFTIPPDIIESLTTGTERP